MMTISSIQSSTIGALRETTNRSVLEKSSGTIASAQSPAATVQFSKESEVFAELSELAKSDPTAFREKVRGMAAEMRSAAETNGDTFLNDLASKFEAAAETGDVASLEPPKGGAPAGARPPGGKPPGGAPPPGGKPPGGPSGAGGKADANGGASATNASEEDDPADTNGDGVVSAQEKLLYSLSQMSDSVNASEGQGNE